MNGAVPTSPPTKTCRPKGAAHKLIYYQLFCNEHAATQRRGAGREAGLPSLNATLRSRERGGKAIRPPAPALRIKRHARNTR